MKIFTLLDRSNYKTTYYLKETDKKPKIISKEKWFKLYDKNIEVLPPLTIES